MKLKNLALFTAISLAISGNSFANSTPKGTIYLTFDDGPINASVEVIKVLNQGGVKATFYFNAWHGFVA